ncbi:MAG: hypothetical protein ACLQDM_04635 [Bradyrhizobium sp.]
MLPERSGRGPAFVVVAMADGRRRSIRRSATDLGGPAVIASEPGPDLLRVSARTPLTLAHHLARTIASSSMEEVIRDDNPCLSASRCVSSADQGAVHGAAGLVRSERPDTGPGGADSCRTDASDDVRNVCDGGAPSC